MDQDKILALASNPRSHNSIKLTSDEGYRVRSGDYGILYRIDEKARPSIFTASNTGVRPSAS